MAKKPDITVVSSGFNSQATLNANLTALQEGFTNTVSRDGSTPNEMNADFDMNSNDVLNAKDVSAQRLILAGIPVVPTELTEQGTGFKTRAEFVTAVAAGISVLDGAIVSAGGVLYEADVTSTLLSGLPGFKPFGTLTPLHFGAVGDNTTDDATAMQALIDHLKVFQNPNNVGILDDDVPQVVELMGKSYVVGATLDLADLYYVTFQNGQIIADSGATWGADDYVLYIARPQATDMVRQQRIRAVTFDNVKIHGNAVANCVYLENTYEVVLSNLYILDWVSGGYGVRTSDRSALPVTKNTHLKILNVTASQKELSQSHVGDGTALYIETADFMMDNVTVFKAAVGLHLNGFSNGQISNFHSFVDAANICWFVGPNCNHIVFNNVYSDTGRVVHQSFNHTYSGAIFGSSSVIELDAVDTVGEDGNGLTFVGGLFVNNPSYTASGTGSWAADTRVSFVGSRRTAGGHVFGSGIETGLNGGLALVSNDIQRFLLNGSGCLVPATGQGNSLDLGESGNTVRRLYSNALFIGTTEATITSGTFADPNGNVAAPPGSLFLSSTGGASATLWVKETGTGNTGWIAK